MVVLGKPAAHLISEIITLQKTSGDIIKPVYAVKHPQPLLLEADGPLEERFKHGFERFQSLNPCHFLSKARGVVSSRVVVRLDAFSVR